MCCISVGRSQVAPISPGYSMVNQRHDPRSASRWPAIKRLTEPKCCVFYKTSRNSSLCCRPICQGVTMYTWVPAQLSTNSTEALQRTRKHIKQSLYSTITVLLLVMPSALVVMCIVGSSSWTAERHIPDDSNLVFLNISVVLGASIDKVP